MFSPAASEAQASNAPGTWYVWTRGDTLCEGSSVPFQDVMLTVSKAMSTINNCRGTETEKYNMMKKLQQICADCSPMYIRNGHIGPIGLQRCRMHKKLTFTGCTTTVGPKQVNFLHFLT